MNAFPFCIFNGTPSEEAGRVSESLTSKAEQNSSNST